MRTSHAILLRFRHDPQYDFKKVSVDYINRGAPDDVSTVLGDRIASLESGGMEIESEKGQTHIPYHRIARICYEEIPVWELSPGKVPSRDELT
ncbi:MAG TPA: DUF504 domain-containing protein [Methanotrichaceae archaeon]|nr:DUF504 domain-containing protein [Methanotrichaceae archaeon]